MDLRAQTSVLAAVIALAIAVGVVVRDRRRPVHWLFGLFGLSLALWYGTAALGRVFDLALFDRVNLVCAVVLPVSVILFFRAFLGAQGGAGEKRLTAVAAFASAVGLILILVVFTPFYQHPALTTSIFVFLVVMSVVPLVTVFVSGLRSRSRFEGAQLRYISLFGALAATVTTLEYLPYLGVDIPPVGTVLVLVFLFAIAQSVIRYRLLNLYEVGARLVVLTAVAFLFALVIWLLVQLAGGRFFLHSVVASIALLIVVDPIRNWVERQSGRLLLGERKDLQMALTRLGRRLARVLELGELTSVLLQGLHSSDRMTHASLFLVDQGTPGYRRLGFFGPEPPARVDPIVIKPLLRELRKYGKLEAEDLRRRMAQLREERKHGEWERIRGVVKLMDELCGDVVVALPGGSRVIGFLSVKDDRSVDAFSPEEVVALVETGKQAAAVVENSQMYREMRERDRLAALGEMAAGLAHEIRNPLGAIKGSAQMLTELEQGQDGGQGELLDIIVGEVNRLDSVVGSFLDYARTPILDAQYTDVNAIVDQTMRLMGSACEQAGVTWTTQLDADAAPVQVHPDRLKQVLLNLVRNAVQAMDGGGTLHLGTRPHQVEDASGKLRGCTEVRVVDSGPGISERVMTNLFVPFVTTKTTGTGLGLAISQRIVRSAGGHIEVQSSGEGTTFTVRLPTGEPVSAGETANSVEASR